jgi:siroheme synthase-like protein
MKLFPAFLDLANRSCLVVGGGRAGLEKARALLAAGATVLVVEPRPSPELLAEVERQPGESDAPGAGARLGVEGRAFRAGDCRGRTLVFACTGIEAVDDDVAAAARDARALCCRVDGVPADFTTGAVLRRGDLCVAVSSGAASPRLAIEARDRTAEAIGPEYGEAARLLGGLRRGLRAGQRPRSPVMGAGLVRDLLEALRSGDEARAHAMLEEARASTRNSAEKGEGSCTR